MKKILLLFFLLLGLQSVEAQVTNYALRLQTPEANVNLGEQPELNGLDTYTLQMWVCPTQWTPGASLLSRGDMSLKLGSQAGELVYVSGQTQIVMSATPLAANVWTHLTLSYGDGKLTLWTNNKQVSQQAAAGQQWTETTEPLVVGGLYTGRIDELRVWKGILPQDYERFWRNTLNEYCPYWDQLVSYYTFDQVRCPAVYDYSGHEYHGTFSAQGTDREAVTDNENFCYRIHLAYADWSRFCDRMVDAPKYRLANYVSMIGIKTFSDGTAQLQFPWDEAQTEGGTHWLSEYEGRKGVMAFDGQTGSCLSCTTDVLNSEAGYTFMSWVYLDEWTEGAYIFRRERSETEGFSIRLGSAETRQVIVRCNGHEYIRDKKLKAGVWTHLCVTTNASTNQGEVFLFSFDGVGSFPSRGNFPSELYSTQLPDLTGVKTCIGEGLKGKMDDIIIWNTQRQQTEIQAEMTTPKVPGPQMSVDAVLMRSASAYWDFDRAEMPGYDNYSYRHFFNIIRECYGERQGYHLLICASGHEGWESTFANTTKRNKLAKALAEIANLPDFDGLDLDFEWTYSQSGWQNYALLCKTIRENLAEGKTLSVSPHQVAYGYPVNMMQYVDFFNFQVYGPGQVYLFTESGYTSALNDFVKHGYPPGKIVMSYATTTSGGCDAAGNVIRNGNSITYAPVGYRSFYNAATAASDNRAKFGENYYYYTGYDQSVWRSQQCHEQKLGGIMYWDMGNDIATSNPLSLARGASQALNSNVVPLYTSVSGQPEAIEIVYSHPSAQASAIYTLDGRRVAAPHPRGLYISKGRKTLLNK